MLKWFTSSDLRWTRIRFLPMAKKFLCGNLSRLVFHIPFSSFKVNHAFNKILFIEACCLCVDMSQESDIVIQEK